MNNCACQNQNKSNNNQNTNNLKNHMNSSNVMRNEMNNSERIYNYMNNLRKHLNSSNNSRNINDLKKECILNSRIFFMPETEFDEIEDGIYKVLFIGRNNAYLFKSIKSNSEIKLLTPSIRNYEYEYQDIPKYHLSKFDSKVIFDNVKNKIFMRTKVLNITYRDYDIRLICKSKDNKNKYKSNLSEYQDYVHNYLYPTLKKIELSIRISNNCLKLIRLYNDKDLLKDYDKYSGIYYPDEDFEYKLKKQFITRYKPDNLLIEFESEDEDDEVKIYDNEYGFMKARMYYKPHSETEYCEIRVYCKEEYDDNDEMDDDLIQDRKSYNNRRRERLNENTSNSTNEMSNSQDLSKQSFSEGLIDYDEDLEYLIDEENNYYNDRYIQLKRSNKNKRRRIINNNNIYDTSMNEVNKCSELHDLKELFENDK